MVQGLGLTCTLNSGSALGCRGPAVHWLTAPLTVGKPWDAVILPCIAILWAATWRPAAEQVSAG